MIRTVNPIPNETATVDSWHADDGTFLRGTQLTDRNGQVRFAPYSSHAARDTHPLRTGGTAMTTIDLTPIDTTSEEFACRHITTVEIVIPVYNEEADLEISIRRLHGYLVDRFPLSWVVTIVDNASTDRTWSIARRLSQELDDVSALHLDRKGRGRALRRAWSDTDAAVVAYMDVDLSTDLDALLPLIAPLVSGHSDLAIGTRLAPGSRVVRGPRREVISRIYNLLLKVGLHSRFSDAQCGFKAVRSDVVRTARDDLEGIWRMRRQRASLRP
jgi:hypothetical protein